MQILIPEVRSSQIDTNYHLHILLAGSLFSPQQQCQAANRGQRFSAPLETLQHCTQTETQSREQNDEDIEVNFREY